MQGIKLKIINEDAFKAETDVLALKYAQMSHGLDRRVIKELAALGSDVEDKLPENGRYLVLDSLGVVSAPKLIFIGTPKLSDFSYKEIRGFSRTLLSALKNELPGIKNLTLTIHGPGYGLDEIEAFESQLAGIMDSISAEDYPEALEQINFVEKSTGRAKRLNEFAKTLFPTGTIPTAKAGGLSALDAGSSELLRAAGYESESKKKIFVAMPFAEEFDDLFHYGIQGAVNAAGYLCERADLESFTGNVMEWVKKRIETAELVIADLSHANPNVYLEVGYAWGKHKPTVLIVNAVEDLKFDVQDQRCIPYKSIRDLENSLTKELQGLKVN